VEYRNTTGIFTQPEDLMNVKGIGKKIFELNKDRIIVGAQGGATHGKDNNVSQRETEAGRKG
jgi:competence protein ComEA